MSKFSTVADMKLNLLSAAKQMAGEPSQIMSLQEALDAGVIGNTAIAYFLGRINLFMEKLGVDVKRLRFRQHMGNEMAHYACDCWDAELLTSYGWVECVGCADRSAFDLTQHYKATGVKLCAEKKLSAPVTKDVTEIQPNKGPLGKAFKKDAKTISEKLAALSLEEITKMESELESGSASLELGHNKVSLTPDMVS